MMACSEDEIVDQLATMHLHPMSQIEESKNNINNVHEYHQHDSQHHLPLVAKEESSRDLQSIQFYDIDCPENISEEDEEHLGLGDLLDDHVAHFFMEKMSSGDSQADRELTFVDPTTQTSSEGEA